jgi:hypothetical protein
VLTVSVSSAKPSNMREMSEKKMTLKYSLPASAQELVTQGTVLA